MERLVEEIVAAVVAAVAHFSAAHATVGVHRLIVVAGAGYLEADLQKERLMTEITLATRLISRASLHR
jgi:putative NADH-flavin reductase